MATLATMLANINTKLLANLPLTPARLPSDLEVVLQRIPAGVTRYQLRTIPDQDLVEDANPLFIPSVQLELSIHYHLTSGEVENTYTEVELATMVETLSDPTFWDTIVGVFGVAENPRSEIPTRIGDVISVQVVTTIILDQNA